MDDLISRYKLKEVLLCGWCTTDKSDEYRKGLMDALRVAEAIEPVNAVELPCKIGDTLFELCFVCGGIHKREVHGFNIRENGMFIVCDTTNFEKREIGKQVFLSRGKAEEALEDLKNENEQSVYDF